MNVITPTDLSSKATEVISSVYKSFGGSGSSPDIAEFKKTLDNASPELVDKARQRLWDEIVNPLREQQEQGGEIPALTNLEEVMLVGNRYHEIFTQVTMGARAQA